MQLLINFLLTTGVLALSLISLILFNRKGSVLPRRILGVIFILFLFVTLHTYGEVNNLSWLIWIGFPITDTIGFLMGPLLYFYVVSLFRPKYLRLKVISLHLLPAIIYLLLVSLPFLISMIKGNYILEFLEFIDQNGYLLHFQAFYLLASCLWSLRILSRYRHISKTYYSNLKKLDIQWVQHLLWGVICIMVLDLGIELLSVDFKILTIPGDQILTLTLVALIIYLAYYGTYQSQILLPDSVTNNITTFEQKNTKTAKHHLANATPEEVTQLKNRLYHVLKSQKPFTDENLTLASLAKLLPTTDRKLSALLKPLS